MRKQALVTFCAAVACVFAALTEAARAGQPALLTLFWAPYIDRAENGDVTGMAPALVDKILEGAGLHVAPRLLPWPRLYKSVQSEPDVLAFTMVRMPEREAMFQWLAPLFVSEPGVLIYERANAPPQPHTIEDLRKYKLCVTPGNSFYVKLRALGFEQNKNLFEFATLFPETAAGQQWYIFQGQCDFRVTNWAPVTALMRKRGVADPQKHLGFYPAPEAMFGPDMETWLVASRSFDSAQIAAIKTSADRLRASGALWSICRQTYGFDEKTCALQKPN
ncbi:MAG: transporter substrate-binding domain-containing protein [Hyphomicrobiales bacterium]|nr:transporter substrate-binding domain-containing protein [Hyphomicrobiales bacterium]